MPHFVRSAPSSRSGPIAENTLRPATSPNPIRNPKLRALVYQLAFGLAVAALFWFLVTNTLANLQRQGIATGFDFLNHQAGYVVGESFIPHSASVTFGRIMLIGLLNTIYVCSLAIVLSTVTGVLLGLARLSSNWLVARLCAAYVLVFRNVPLLLQIVFWYSLSRQLPAPRQALEPISGVFLSNRGMAFPWLVWHPGLLWVIAALLAAIAATFLAWRMSRGRDGPSPRSILLAGALGSILLPALVWRFSGAPLEFSVPSLQGFNFRGGLTFSPELAGLLTAMVVYNTAFIAEIVRAGLQSVDRGQTEAAVAIGLRPMQVMRHVVLPQAVRVSVPPMISQYLNVVKDSTLAVWIGYPELVAVTATAINLTGQALEPLFLIMLVYLAISLTLSILMNIYNSRTLRYAR